MFLAIVRMETPAADHDFAVKISLETTSTYTALKDKGLLMKYYLSQEAGGSGGLYVWRSRKDAEAWFTPEWKQRLKQAYGAEPSVTYYDSFVHVDNINGEIVVDGKPI